MIPVHVTKGEYIGRHQQDRRHLLLYVQRRHEEWAEQQAGQFQRLQNSLRAEGCELHKFEDIDRELSL